jgi:hypothetical protein
MRPRAKGSAVAATNIIQCIPIAAGEIVTDVFARILVASGTSSAPCTVGDGDDPDGWIASVTLTSAADTYFGAGGALKATSLGKLYAAADTIDITIGATAPADGLSSIELFAVIVPTAK